VQHFIIGVTMDNQYTFEEDKFPTIPMLIDHYVQCQIPVTESSGLVLKNPVSKLGSSDLLSDTPPPRPPMPGHSAEEDAPMPPRPSKILALNDYSADSTALLDQPWFHGKVDKSALKGILHYEGDYLVRESTRNPGEYTCSVRGPQKVKHFNIASELSGYKFEGDAFPTIYELCEHYRKFSIPVTVEDGYILRTPISVAQGGTMRKLSPLKREGSILGGFGTVRALQEQPWFHGTITRKEIKGLLREAGDYLVRESSKNPGDNAVVAMTMSRQRFMYAVSVFHDQRVQHFIINSSGTEFTLEDASFSSIAELVEYHRTEKVPVTDLSGAFLLNPITKSVEEEPLPPSLPSRSSRDVAQTKPPEDLTNYDWFHGKLERADAKHLLRNVGDYLVRESTKKPGELAVSAKGPQKTQHFIIDQTNNQFRFEGDAYESVYALLEHYRSFQMPVTNSSGVLLITPINKIHVREEYSNRINKKYDAEHSDVKLSKKLGNGHFGEVMLGTMVKDNRKVAVKTQTSGDPSRFLEEGDVLKGYEHPNIVQLIGVVPTKPIYIILELCEGGELLKWIRKRGTNFDVGKYIRMSTEGGMGMAYLHEKNCIHRDLAARNCLVTGDGVVKISDFGMSRITEGDEDLYTVQTTAKTIPIKWTAPEVLTEMQYTLACDIWSYGVLLWEIFSGGQMPYGAMSNAQTREAVVRKDYRMPPPDKAPQEIQQLMVECWSTDPEDRPTMADIVDYLSEVQEHYPEKRR